MRALLIDPEAHDVREVEYTGDYRQIYELIGAEPFDVFYLPDSTDACFVDDEGTMRRPLPPSFLVLGYPHELFGRGLVLGTDGRGNSIEPKLTLDELRKRVAFVLRLPDPEES